MHILGFVGASGTGKSYHALVVAYEHHIDCMIDDGLLIYQNRIVAGWSAKEAPDRMKAVRCAVFLDPVHAASVREALEHIQPQGLLILGTSEHMVHRICASLQLPLPDAFIHIEDISSPEEIAKARAIRIEEGKHIIPVPTMELRAHFKGMLLQPLKSFFKGDDKRKEFERSVVRPVFSYYGKLILGNDVITSLVRHAAYRVKGIVKIHSAAVSRREGTRRKGLAVTISVTISQKTETRELMRLLKDAIQKEVEYTTGMSVDMLKITIQQVVHTSP